jgi:hypothetical protein
MDMLANLMAAASGGNTYGAVEAYRKSTFSAISAIAGVANLATSTAYVETVGCFSVYNTADVEATTPTYEWIEPVYLRMTQLAVNTAGTRMQFDFTMDNIDRHSSGGTELTGVATAFSGDSAWADRTSKAEIHCGLLTLTAASADVKILARPMASSVIGAVEDVYMIVFGSTAEYHNTSDSDFHVIGVPRMPIGPGANLMVHQIAPSQSDDPLFQYEFGYIEHPPTDQTS